MDPNVWGPPLWDMLFTLAFKCDKKCAIDMQHIAYLLEKIMPCSHCRRSYILYKKQLKPTTVITPEHPNSAALWLWSIHDMVNQKLGKICISFEKLQKRHAAITSITHDLLIFDIFVILTLSVKDSMRQYVVDFINCVCRLIDASELPFQISIVLKDNVRIEKETILDNLFEVHRQLFPIYGAKLLTREDFDQKYKNAYA